MLKVLTRKKFGFFKVSDVYYADSIQNAITDEDVIYFVQSREDNPYKDNEKTMFNTLHIDITKDIEELLKNFDRRTRTDIRKVEDKGMVETHFYTEVTDKIITEFEEYYNIFSDIMGIAPMNKGLVEALSKSGHIVVSKACYGSCGASDVCKKDDILAMHMYIVDEDRARVLYSGSSRFSFDKDADKHFVARANRMLHFKDIQGFQNMGKTIYDFGGLFLDEAIPSHLGIDRFKRGFGGDVVVEYSYPYPVTRKGRLYLMVKGKFKKTS